VQRFTQLRVWQRSHAFVCRIYPATASFPPHERYGLVSQLRRAAASIPTNLAEGAKRKGRTDYARFINVAEGSAAEVEYLLLLCRDLRYLSREDAGSLSKDIDQISRMLHALRVTVERPPLQRPEP